MKKFKFNLKLTIFLVSLFVSLLLIVLGSKNKYCLSFGFMLLGASLIVFLTYAKEKIQNSLNELSQDIDEIDVNEEISEEDKVYIMKELFIRQKQLSKKKISLNIVFCLCGFMLVVFGLISLF